MIFFFWGGGTWGHLEFVGARAPPPPPPQLRPQPQGLQISNALILPLEWHCIGSEINPNTAYVVRQLRCNLRCNNIPGAPPPPKKKKKKKKKKKTEQSIQSIFQDFALINSYLFSLCWIEHLLLMMLTPRSSNLVENFLSYESFLMDCHFWDLPDFQSSEARLMTASAASTCANTCVGASIQPATKKSQCQ